MDWLAFWIGVMAGVAACAVTFTLWAALIVSKRADRAAQDWPSTQEWLDEGGHVKPADDDGSSR